MKKRLEKIKHFEPKTISFPDSGTKTVLVPDTKSLIKVEIPDYQPRTWIYIDKKADIKAKIKEFKRTRGRTYKEIIEISQPIIEITVQTPESCMQSE